MTDDILLGSLGACFLLLIALVFAWNLYIPTKQKPRVPYIPRGTPAPSVYDFRPNVRIPT